MGLSWKCDGGRTVTIQDEERLGWGQHLMQYVHMDELEIQLRNLSNILTSKFPFSAAQVN